MRLGKQAHKHDDRTMALGEFIAPTLVVPSRYDFDKERTPFPTKMWGNDEWGDCVIAGRANQLLRFERVEQRRTLPLTDEIVISEYQRLCQEQFGAAPQSAGDENDNGLIVLDSLKSWRNEGWRLKSTKKRSIDVYTIAAYGELHPNDPLQLRQAIYLFHGIQLGFWLPRAVQGASEWVYDGETGADWKPGSWGGHLVTAFKYDQNSVTVISWGQKIMVNNSFVEKFCTTPQHRALTSDLRWVPVGDLKAGDKLVGFEENSASGFGNGHGGRKYREATVISTTAEMAQVVDVETSEGEILTVTLDHRWLTKPVAKGAYWIKTQQFQHGLDNKRPSHLRMVIPPWEEKRNYDRGYIASVLDCEGCVLPTSHQLEFAQNPGVVLDRSTAILKKLGIDFSVSNVGRTSRYPNNNCQQVHIKGSLPERLAVLGSLRPERLISRLNANEFGRLHFNGHDATVKSISKPYKAEISKVATDTGTLIIDGYPMHNCDEAWAVVDNLNYWRRRPEFDLGAMLDYLKQIGAKGT